MTFEDFFIKKRIDLARLQRAMPVLYEEFHNHFQLMGEKSFDHSKKYWFNRLRKDFLLGELKANKASSGEEPMLPPKTAADGISSDSKSSRPTGFKPRYKPGNIKIVQKGATNIESDECERGEKQEEAEPTVVQTVAPTTLDLGFKPRSKVVGAIKSKEKNHSDDSCPEDSKKEDKFKPSITNTDETALAKPLGFKPRFKSK